MTLNKDWCIDAQYFQIFSKFCLFVKKMCPLKLQNLNVSWSKCKHGRTTLSKIMKTCSCMWTSHAILWCYRSTHICDKTTLSEVIKVVTTDEQSYRLRMHYFDVSDVHIYIVWYQYQRGWNYMTTNGECYQWNTCLDNCIKYVETLCVYGKKSSLLSLHDFVKHMHIGLDNMFNYLLCIQVYINTNATAAWKTYIHEKYYALYLKKSTNYYLFITSWSIHNICSVYFMYLQKSHKTIYNATIMQ